MQRLSDSQISRIIENGIPGTGMPAFRSLGSPDTKALLAYLRTLQGTKTALKLPGDSERGRTLFSNKAECSRCHMIGGKGGFIASDLSLYARAHSAEQIRDSITKPASSNDRQARLATATTRGGEKFTGRVRNEDNFSLQLQTLDGTFHFISKSDLESLEYDPNTTMHSDKDSKLTAADLNDIVSYLINVATSGTSQTHSKAEEQE